MKKRRKILHIVASVMNYYDVDEETLNSKTRKAEIVQIRHVIVYMIRYELGLTFREISDILNKENSTIIRNFQTISDQIMRDKMLQLEIQDIKKEIRKKIEKNI